ncbi:BA14K family protein [Phenylobacterium sp.]|uniref:BA14K family protein n=1 Tax=Phenylobacterium sp. TaxID=1871053 RepID=UPI0035B3CA6B
MRRFALIGLAAAGLALPSAAAFAQAPRQDQPKAETAKPQTGKQEAPGKPAAQAAPGKGETERYGRWETSWGAKPPAPPKTFAKPADWHRHVRACQLRYKSYNPRTDTFMIRPGVARRCTR